MKLNSHPKTTKQNKRPHTSAVALTHAGSPIVADCLSPHVVTAEVCGRLSFPLTSPEARRRAARALVLFAEAGRGAGVGGVSKPSNSKA